MTTLRITQDYSVYAIKEQRIYPIYESDWLRLKRMIKGIIPHKRIFQIFSSVFFGIFASAIFALIGFGTAKEIAAWVMPTTWAIFSTSLLLGAALLILDNKQKGMIAVSTGGVLEEMEQIEQHFERPIADGANVSKEAHEPSVLTFDKLK